MTRFRLNGGGDLAIFHEQAAQELLSAYKGAKSLDYAHGIGRALMFLGRLLEIKGDYVGARFFYLRSRAIFAGLKSMFCIPAKDYLIGCPHGSWWANRLFEAKKSMVEKGQISAADLIHEHFQKYEHFAA